MYLIAHYIPIYVEGARTFVDDSWYVDLELTRRFVAPVFGPLHVVAPQLPTSAADPHTMLREVDASHPDLALHPSVVDERMRVRRFWPEGIAAWQRDLKPLVSRATVVQSGVDDPFRPMQLAALFAAARANKPTVLFGVDMDVWDTLAVQREQMRLADSYMHVARTVGMDFWLRYWARRADLAMFKEGLVYERYAATARNPKAFCHSMHTRDHLIEDARFEARLASMRDGRPLRFGYCGRFVPRKGLTDAIRGFARAVELGVDATYHLFGSGPQKQELQTLVRELGLGDRVVFEGHYAYGPELHARLQDLDALLFTPTEADTPRMVFDAFAAGLPLVTSDIDFLRLRARTDRASVLFGVGDTEAAAQTLVNLDRGRDRLAALSRRAKERGEHHTVEHWYARRVEWTREAVFGRPTRQRAA